MSDHTSPAANRPFEIGLYSFAELTPDPRTGNKVSPAERIRDLLEEIELANTLVTGIGNEQDTVGDGQTGWI